MYSQRNLFMIALLFLSFLLFQQWQIDYGQTSLAPIASTTLAAHGGGNSTDLPGALQTSTLVVQSATEQPQSHLITLESDVLSLTVDTRGGDIVQAKLLAYPRSLDHPEPLLLLESTPQFIYQAQSGLIGTHGPDSSPSGRPLYHSLQRHYQLQDQRTTLQVVLTHRDQQGSLFSKIFTLKRGDYALDVVHRVDNNTAHSLQVQLFGQLKQSVALPKEKATGQSNFAAQTYRGAAYSTAEKRYQKYSFSDIKKNDLAQSSSGGWVAMLQQYFATAWIPNAEQIHHFYSKSINQHQQTLIGFKSPVTTVAPGTQQQLQATLWLGPEIQQKMAAVAKNLDLTVDYGWLWFISQPLFKLLKFLQGFVGNWGFAIILITFIVRGVMYPLTKAQYTSMAKMRALHPRLVTMRERFGDDRQRLSQEMMALYKKEKVNPLGGCLPLLVQMPIFLALYWMLMGSVELRHAPFAGWIHDLSAQDPYYLLPLMMGGTMFVIQKMTPSTVSDPLQQKVMNFMPMLFTLFFLWFPSGLVLYYLVSNLVTILQQQMIYHHLEKKGLSSN